MKIQVLNNRVDRSVSKSLPIIVAMLALLFTACVKDPAQPSTTNSNKIQVLFSIPDQVPGSYATVGALPSEREFDEVSVIFYDMDGKFVAHTSNNVPSNTITGSFEINKPSNVELNKSYKLLVVANLKYYLKDSYNSTGDYIEANKRFDYTTMRLELKAVSNNRISRNLPMYAETEMTITEASTAVSIIFERAVARIDLVSIEKSLDIEWVKVCNYNNSGHIYHNDYNVSGCNIINGAGSGDIETYPKLVNLTRRKDMSDKTAPQSNTAGGLYTFPNINLNTSINDIKTTCLLIKGTYSYTDKEGNPQIKEGYYRVNVCMPNKPQNIKRNNIYRITVKSVSDGGADTEDKAMKNPTANVNYEINDWTVDNSQEIITDKEGNYLAVNPATAYVGGSIGSSMIGNIRVTNNKIWSIEKSVPTDDWFSVAITSDGTGFILKALSDNVGSTPRSSKVSVKVPGTTLQYDIPVYQYTLNSSQDVVLIVDGRMGDFPITIKKTGETITLPVTLGSNSARASISWVSGDESMISSAIPAIGASDITNNSVVTLLFSPNRTATSRSAVYKVTRTDEGSDDISLNITFTQPTAAQSIVVTPSTIFDTNRVDGFMNLPGISDLSKCKSQRVQVTMLGMGSGSKWKATSTFNTYDVTLLSNPSTVTSTYPSTLSNTATGVSGEWFDIAVSRCGPSDADLTGTITIEAYNAEGTVISGSTQVLPLTVYSSLKSGFTQIDKLLYHDRNVGVEGSSITDESLILPSPALPFSTFPGDYQSSESSTTNHKLFRGSYFNFSQAQTACPSGWRIPTSDEFTTLLSLAQFAKAGGRPYIVANTGKDKDTKGCYFPLSGTGMNTIYPCSYYWSSSISGRYMLYFDLTPPSKAIIGRTDASYYIFNVRCVKDIVE